METVTDRNAKIAEAMLGNKNPTKNKLFYDRLRMELTQNPAKLAKIVDALLEKAQEGEAWAVNTVMDRVDGKAIQTSEITGADGEPLQGIQVTFVKPNE
jgi:hypothetical protein